MKIGKNKLFDKPITLGVMGEALAVGLMHGLHDDELPADVEAGELLSYVLGAIGHSLEAIDSTINGHEFMRQVSLMMAEEELRNAKSKGQKMMYRAFIQSLKEAGRGKN